MFGAGHRFVGEFQRDSYHGFGTMTYKPFKDEKTGETFVGKRYEGMYKNGKYDGRGIFSSGNGYTYSGYFEKGLYHGEGTLRCPNGDMYIGEWSRGKPDGKISVTYENDGKPYSYDGHMSSGRYSGQGVE